MLNMYTYIKKYSDWNDTNGIFFFVLVDQHQKGHGETQLEGMSSQKEELNSLVSELKHDNDQLQTALNESQLSKEAVVRNYEKVISEKEQIFSRLLEKLNEKDCRAEKMQEFVQNLKESYEEAVFEQDENIVQLMVCFILKCNWFWVITYLK